MKTLLLAFTAAACLPASAAIVSHTFTGVTNSNVVDPGDFTTEFPVGTKWTVVVEWDSASAPLFTSDSQGQYRLTKFTLSLQGKTGTWTTSSLAEKASFTLNKFGSHEMQFTSGFDPSHYTNQNIEGLQPWSINVTLKDPTGTAIGAFTPAPTGVDMSKWDIATSQFKFYLSNGGAPVVFGTLAAPVKGPEISLQQPAGSELTDGTSKKSFGTAKLGKSVTKTFTIRNTGTAPLKNLAVVVAGKHKQDFTASAPVKKSLAPGAGTTVKVTFKPTAKGTRNAAVQVKSNDKDENPFDIKVTGLGAK